MISFIADNISTILISLLLIFIVAMIIRKMIKDKKKGKSSCGCGCAGCAMSDSCHAEK